MNFKEYTKPSITCHKSEPEGNGIVGETSCTVVGGNNKEQKDDIPVVDEDDINWDDYNL